MSIEYPPEGLDNSQFLQEKADHANLLSMPLPFSEGRPDFIPQERIERQADQLKEELNPHLLAGVSKFIEKFNLSSDFGLDTQTQQQAWLWAVKSSKYNAVYFISRRETQENLDFVKENAQLIDTIGNTIDANGGVARIANYALHSYAQGFAQTEGREIKTARKSIPSTAIQGYDEKTIIVKKSHFLDADPLVSFENPQEIHDWHDVAHILAASSSEGSFGVKYHDGLDDLDRYYRALTEGEGMQDASGPAFSDGILFTQLSKPIFEFYESQKLADGSNEYSYDQIKTFIARELFMYLGGGYPVYHPGVKENVMASRAISPLELAVSEQNKRCERRAAEVETEVLVRGTPEGSRGNPAKDPLNELSRSQRIQQVADFGNELVYFEARNLTRHRAHEDALGQYAAFALQQKQAELANATVQDREALSDDVALLQATVDFYQMTDLKQGQEINLYQLVGSSIAKYAQ